MHIFVWRQSGIHIYLWVSPSGMPEIQIFSKLIWNDRNSKMFLLV